MEAGVLAVFALVYVGMLLGGLPGLAIDRTGVALLGAVAIVVVGDSSLADAWSGVDMPTLCLLFALMVLSAQFRLAGFYTRVTRWMVSLEASPPALLGAVIALAGVLSAVLTNDVVCLAMTPVLVEGCARRRLEPVPYLLALACASNVGSAATLLGNPQNILIGQRLGLSFAGFLLDAGVPALLGLGATWAWIAWQFRGRWRAEREAPAIAAPPPNDWQSFKGIAVAAALVSVFLFDHEVPRHGIALAFAALLLLSRRMATREMLGLVDWQLLVLFIGLFIVNHAFQQTGAMDATLQGLRARGVDPSDPVWLFGLGAVLSNVVSNVPATMLLLPSATHPLAGAILALSSTLAGNLLIIGSIANMIVVGAAQPLGVTIDVRTHARTGVPVTLITLALAALWLWARVALG